MDLFDLIKETENRDLGIINEFKELIDKISNYSLDDKVEVINSVKTMMHEISPFNSEPVDCVLWVKK